MSCAVVFGGTGFIGAFFAQHLLESGWVEKVYLFDREPIEQKSSSFRKELVASLSGVELVQGDVRESIQWAPAEPVELIANFAAVHREPGHQDHEYYETNLKGAENVCSWADRLGCRDLIFASSISPYGPSEAERNESSLPVPATAYGGSKLAAEKIHYAWLASDIDSKNLVIVRPGVVFGPGEGGNVSRLIKAVLGKYFFYMGNKETRKAGVYVKELCNAMLWVLQTQVEAGRHYTLFNMSMNPAPSVSDYVGAVCKVAGVRRHVVSVPYIVLYIVASLVDVVARPLRVSHPFSPVRINKLVRSNNIRPQFLIENGYGYKYTLETAFADWRKSCPAEW